MDCCRFLRGWARRLGNVSGKTDGAETGFGYGDARARFANGNSSNPRAFAVTARLT